MDDTALNPQQQSQPTAPVPPVQTPGVTQQPAVQTQVNTVQPQQPVRPVVQQPVTAGHPEAPARSGLPPRDAAPIDQVEAIATASDDSAAQPDEGTDVTDAKFQEAADVKMQESHPKPEISPELQQAGVEQGKDAVSEHREEEQLATKDDQQKQPDTQASASGVSISSSPVHLEEVKKKNGIRSAIKWLAVAIIRQLKRMQMKPEEQKTTW